MSDTINYSNPRNSLTVQDWPSGNKRVVCEFTVETKVNKGQRVSRTTTTETGKVSKPKCTTYSERYAIFDGSDGKTYLLGFSWDMISVYPGTMKFSTETIHQSSSPERYQILKSMIDSLDIV